MSLPLSILDLAPVPEGTTTPEALARLVELAQLGDRLGFTRVWYAEHHGMPSIASSSPDVLIATAAARTERIRVGSGGVMLPNHVPLRVVETYRTLAAADANAKLQPLMPAQGCNGYWHGKPGLETWKADAQGALQQVMETA